MTPVMSSLILGMSWMVCGVALCDAAWRGGSVGNFVMLAIIAGASFALNVHTASRSQP